MDKLFSTESETETDTWGFVDFELSTLNCTLVAKVFQKISGKGKIRGKAKIPTTNKCAVSNLLLIGWKSKNSRDVKQEQMCGWQT